MALTITTFVIHVTDVGKLASVLPIWNELFQYSGLAAHDDIIVQ